MNKNEILLKITDLLRDIFDDETLQVSAATTSDDVSEWDSTNHVRLMVAIEEEFGIRFDTDELTEPRNVGEIFDLVDSKINR